MYGRQVAAGDESGSDRSLAPAVRWATMRRQPKPNAPASDCRRGRRRWRHRSASAPPTIWPQPVRDGSSSSSASRGFGAGSTGRCAGGFRHQFSSRVNVELSLASIPLIVGFEATHGLPLDVVQDGYLFLVRGDAAWAGFRAAAEMQRGLGVDVRLLAPRGRRRARPRAGRRRRDRCDVLPGRTGSPIRRG